MVLVGNKIDLENQRVVTQKRGRKVSRCGCTCRYTNICSATMCQFFSFLRFCSISQCCDEQSMPCSSKTLGGSLPIPLTKTCRAFKVMLHVYTSIKVINPRCACARVTEVVSVCLLLNISLFQCHKRYDLSNGQ